ncbi:MAG TPA: AraC family transcriptional regulator, partial [Bryobacteraceae bacterium]|nr:AraC family transcriptional regulator [Bryobacteraceae bacterium]
QCAKLLSEACLDPPSASRLYGESLTTALLAAFWSNPDRTPRKRRSGGLSPWQLRLSIEYLKENFTRDISLQDLVNLSGLSQSQFARAFKVSTGLPPYQWVLQARVQKSQEMLAKADEPVASIAAGVGFADQSHFTKAFRRVTGITPKRWQRDRKKLTPPDPDDAPEAFAACK